MDCKTTTIQLCIQQSFQDFCKNYGSSMQQQMLRFAFETLVCGLARQFGIYLMSKQKGRQSKRWSESPPKLQIDNRSFYSGNVFASQKALETTKGNVLTADARVQHIHYSIGSYIGMYYIECTRCETNIRGKGS